MPKTPAPLKTSFVSIRLSPAEHQAVKVRAARKGIPMGEYLKLATAFYQKSGPKD